MKKVKGMYLPLVLIILYLVVSYAMYRFGCYVWPFRNDLLTAIFVLLCIVACGVGYVLAVKKYKGLEREDSILSLSPEKVLIAACIISVILYIPVCKAYTNSWYPPIVETLLNLKGTYYELADVALNRTGVRIWGFLDVFSYVLLPLALWAWDEVKKRVRFTAIIVAIAYLMIYISSARNIAVAIQMLSVVAVWLSVVFSKKKKGVARITLMSVVYVFLVAIFFSTTMSQRTGYDEKVYVALQDATVTEQSGTNTIGSVAQGESVEEIKEESEEVIEREKEDQKKKEQNAEKIFERDAERYNKRGDGQTIGIGEYNKNGLVIDAVQLANFSTVYSVFPNYTDVWSKGYVNMNDVLVRNLPSTLSNLYAVGTVYITNGYNCLTVALHTPHQWTFGIGHSSFLSSYVDRFLGTNISNRTYYSRLSEDEEYPLVSKSLWPSTFVQWADDFTFVGVVVVMLLVGFCIAKVWASILVNRNYWGVLLWGQLMLGVLFIPANNILENSGGFFVTFWSLFLAWLMSQIRAKKGQPSEIDK
mgnify:FL=1